MQAVEKAEHTKPLAYCQGIQLLTGLLLPGDKLCLQLASVQKAKILAAFNRTLSNNK